MLLVLLWIHYEVQIVPAGAEFTRVVAGHRPTAEPSEWAPSAGGEGKAGFGPGDDAAVDIGG
jgi:hypothetical protein